MTGHRQFDADPESWLADRRREAEARIREERGCK
jgi:hypothetical protein